MLFESRSIGSMIMMFVFAVFLVFFLYFLAVYAQREKGVSNSVYDHRTMLELFLLNEEDIKYAVESGCKKADTLLVFLLDISKEDRTYENTILLFDRITQLSDLALLGHVLEAFILLHPDPNIRKTALEQKTIIVKYFTDNILQNTLLYNVLKESREEIEKIYGLSDEKKYCIQQILTEFERTGVHLPPEKKQQFSLLTERIELTGSTYTQNISSDNIPVVVPLEALKGLPDYFIKNLKKTDDDRYLLTTDYPTYFTIMEECLIEETRKKLYIAFQNRGYPKNQEELEILINTRNKLAHLLNFPSFASYDIANQMIKTTKNVRSFLYELATLVEEKVEKEVTTLKEEAKIYHLLKENNKIDPWNTRFLVKRYQKRFFGLDETEISHYFPLGNTLKQLYSLYEDFFNILLVPLESEIPLYHPDVSLLAVKNRENDQIIGYFLLDLFPRPHKYSHAAHLTVVPAVSLLNNLSTVPLSIIIANFAQEQSDSPALLKFDEVKTFFHEFGHALHALFGKTQLASVSGTSVKTDFVEMPSQMLEEWLYEPEVLERISRHYKTAKPLPNGLIDRIIKNKNLFAGTALKRQLFFAFLALEYYDRKPPLNLFEIMKELHETLRPEIEFYEQDHVYANFSHLVGYGAKYYGYLYSKVFALDLFDGIKYALFDSSIGKKYKEIVLQKGGSQDPEKILELFLERKPSMQAFINDLLKDH